MTVHSFSI